MINLITYIVSTIFTYVLGKVSKKKGWNETLPIPVQNIIIGLIVFLVSAIIAIIAKQDFNIVDMINQVVVALGGAGTATLYYDTKKEEE